MKIISHRGWWRVDAEKNTMAAFQRTIYSGFGTETDVRDFSGRLVVSHDPAHGDAMDLSELLDKFDRTGLPLALNIKADGLTGLLREAFSLRLIDWFAFDMSGPEMVRYEAAGLPFYTRHSDIEPAPILYDKAKGVWLDAFRGEWFSCDVVARHVDAGKSVCIVSPELHGREPRHLWQNLSSVDGDVTICTDLPDVAKQFLNDD